MGGQEPRSLQAQRWHGALALLPKDPCETDLKSAPLTSAPLAHPAALPQAQARSPAGFGGGTCGTWAKGTSTEAPQMCV